MAMHDFVRFAGITKRFGTVLAVAPLDLQIRKGEFVVLIGPSGCGKTTSLRILAGLETPTDGRIFLAGQDITPVPAKRRDMAMVFQNYALYPHMTVRENMGFALRLRGLDRAAIDAKIRQTAGMLGLDGLLDRRPRELSGGQRQRVAVGRAIVRDPAVFLFDEPLSNLDAKLRGAARSDIRRLQTQLGVTTVYVTHDQVEAMTMADRIVVMRDGLVEQVGAPLEVYDRPASAFVAGFLGNPAMNLIAADAFRHLTGLPADRDTATYGFRPEHVRLAAADPPQRTLRLQARLVQMEPLGAESLLHLSAGPAAFIARLPDERPSLGSGDAWVDVPLAAVQRFDRAGRRLEGPVPAPAAAAVA